MSLTNSGSSVRLIDASVLNGMPILPLRHSINAGSTSDLICFLLPIKLSSTKKMLLRQPKAYRPSNSAMICAAVLVRGRCPNKAVTLQKSQLKGQPRENWILTVS